MTGRNPIADPDRIPMFPALSRMEKRPELQPRHYDREPYWRAPVTPPTADVLVPSWAWNNPAAPDTVQTLTLDANGAYLGALGGIRIAHSGLSHRGPIDWPISPREVLPGYYLIEVPWWAFSGTIVHPLGDSARLQTDTRVWIAHPTLVLLLELRDEGVLTDVVIEDSWTAQVTCDFRKWYDHLRQVRTECLDAIAQAQTDATRTALRERYDAFKEGYSAALSMMLTGEKCKTRRPDWTHAVHAQHAASMWRKGWRWTATGKPLISMGHVDELTVLAEDLPEVMARPTGRPFRFDPSGRSLGAMKPKPNRPTTPAAVSPLPALAEGESVL